MSRDGTSLDTWVLSNIGLKADPQRVRLFWFKVNLMDYTTDAHVTGSIIATLLGQECPPV